MVQVVQSTNTKQTSVQANRRYNSVLVNKCANCFGKLPKSSWKIYGFFNAGQTEKPVKNRSQACHLQMKKTSKDKAKAHSTASETDEVFEALEMAEDVGSKLEAVLKKNLKSLILMKAT